MTGVSSKFLQRRISIVPVMWWLLCAASLIHAQGTAFTFQGRLTDSNVAVNGVYDLQFTIYDAFTNGSTVAGPLSKTATPVSNSLFTVTLDYGATVFPGAPRWVEIGVRAAGSAEAYTTLSPRQAITATPYAITAGTITGPIDGSSI